MAAILFTCLAGWNKMADKHDLLSAVFKVTAKTYGRDRICRIVQYSSKFVAWAMVQRGLSEDLVDKIKALERSVSTARKLFRMGKSLEQMDAARKALHARDSFVRVVVPLSKIASGLYLFCDHFVWAARMKLGSLDEKRWSRAAARFWLFSLILCLSRDVYELICVFAAESRRLKQNSKSLLPSSRPSPLGTCIGVLAHHQPLVLDTVKNSADIFIPLDSLQYLKLPAGVIGLLGTLSSIIGLYTVWNETMKLKQS